MPNWVYNSLTIEGSPEVVMEAKKQLNTSFTRSAENWDFETKSMQTKEYVFDNPVFAFWNIIRPLDMESYTKQPEHKPNTSFAEMFSGDDWYSWNVRNWGTKWDVAISNDEEYPDTELVNDEPNGENHVLVYKFNTAWSPPFPAMEKLSEQYPNLLLTLDYQEETGWGGQAEFVRGKLTMDVTYGWSCMECDHKADETPYCETCEFDMCPACGYGEPMEQDRAKCEEHKNVK